jgi:uncharacterized RDD family membrane protein YckC
VNTFSSHRRGEIGNLPKKSLIPFFYLIELIILYSDGRQRFGDRMAGTYVLRRNPKVAPAPSPVPLRPVDFAAIRNSIQRSKDEHGS